MGWNDADEMIVTYKISTILKNCIYPETQCLIDIFGIVQAKQDSGKSWGDAIKLLLV